MVKTEYFGRNEFHTYNSLDELFQSSDCPDTKYLSHMAMDLCTSVSRKTGQGYIVLRSSIDDPKDIDLSFSTSINLLYSCIRGLPASEYHILDLSLVPNSDLTEIVQREDDIEKAFNFKEHLKSTSSNK